MPALSATVPQTELPDATLRLGANSIALDGVLGYRIEDLVEEGMRMGNIIMLNLFIGAVMALLVGIFAQYLVPRFYLAVGLFALLACAAADDLVRSRGLPRQRLYLLTQDGEKLVFVTPRPLAMQGVMRDLDRLGLQRFA